MNLIGGEVESHHSIGDDYHRKSSYDFADLSCHCPFVGPRGLACGQSTKNVDLTRAKLAESNLSQCNFVGANLSHASMWHANLKDACLDRATMEGTDLDFANLDGCTLKGAWVKKAIFPLARISMDEILEAVKSGQRLRMSSPGHD